MKRYQDKKLLVLGGKPIGSTELVERARQLGAYVIVADYLPKESSPAKLLADEVWDVSTADIETLENLCRENCVSGVLTAVHEFNINSMIALCERLGYPCYCSRETWRFCDNKLDFKSLCINNNIPVACKYDISIHDAESYKQLQYPVIVKPVDGSGSRGFRVCYSADELYAGYVNALQYSPGEQVIVEDYIPYDAVIIHYTMIDGKCFYSGISDKYSAQFLSSGASVMGLQTFPSKGEKQYLQILNDSVISMFEKAGFTDGPIWIEAFYDGNEQFIFNEMGYRFGGSLTYYPVKYFYGIDQLDLMLDFALGYKCKCLQTKRCGAVDNYCIIPVHVKPGVVSDVVGMEYVESCSDLFAYVPVHYKGDIIEEWGSAQQVFCYLHFTYKTTVSLKKSISNLLEKFQVLDEFGNNLLFTLYNLNSL